MHLVNEQHLIQIVNISGKLAFVQTVRRSITQQVQATTRALMMRTTIQNFKLKFSEKSFPVASG